MTRFRLTIDFDGRPFVGWQRQAQGDSVQGAIEAAIAAITGETVLVSSSLPAGFDADGYEVDLSADGQTVSFSKIGASAALSSPFELAAIVA